MGILSRVKIHVQQRFDLEDWDAHLSGLRTDEKLKLKSFLAAKNTIFRGFEVTGLNTNSASINLSDAALLFSQNTNDFSFYVPAPSETTLLIPDADLADNAKNYVELYVTYEDGTPASRAFWDKDGLEGEGVEFNQTVNTMTDLTLNFEVLTGGFSGSPDRLPLAILETDVSGSIRCIIDHRELFGRLATPANIDNDFAFGSKIDPVTQVTLTGVSGTFTAGEEITIGTTTAVVVTGGTTSIAVNNLSDVSFSLGDTVSGDTATGTLASASQAFVGADKSIKDITDAVKALMTEVKKIKGTRQWFEDADSNINELATNIPRDNQDRNLKMIEGGVISLNDDGDELTLSSDAFIQIPGLSFTRNTIDAQTISLPNPESIAFVTLEREPGADVSLTVYVADDDTLLDDNDLLVIARKVNGGVLVGTGTDLVTPGNSINLDGAFSEIERKIGDLNIMPQSGDRVKITGTNTEQLNSSKVSRLFGGKQIIFEGNIIDFTTGDILSMDGVTVVDTFTPFTIPSNQYFWYGLALSAGTTNPDNSVNFETLITNAASANASPTASVKPEINGSFKLGMVQIFNNAGSLEVFDIIETLSADPAGEIPDNSITTPKLVDSAVTVPKLNVKSSARNLNYVAISSNFTFSNQQTLSAPPFANNHIINNVWVSYSNSQLSYSLDGITWSAASTFPNSQNKYGIAYANGVYVITAQTNASIGPIYSTDLISWTNCSGSLAGVMQYTYITVANNMFFIAGSSGNMFSSSDGITFTAVGGTSSSKSIVYCNGVYIKTSAFVSPIAYSYDLNTWTNISNFGTIVSAINYNNSVIIYGDSVLYVTDTPDIVSSYKISSIIPSSIMTTGLAMNVCILEEALIVNGSTANTVNGSLLIDLATPNQLNLGSFGSVIHKTLGMLQNKLIHVIDGTTYYSFDTVIVEELVKKSNYPIFPITGNNIPNDTIVAGHISQEVYGTPVFDVSANTTVSIPRAIGATIFVSGNATITLSASGSSTKMVTVINTSGAARTITLTAAGTNLSLGAMANNTARIVIVGGAGILRALPSQAVTPGV